MEIMGTVHIRNVPVVLYSNFSLSDQYYYFEGIFSITHGKSYIQSIFISLAYILLVVPIKLSYTNVHINQVIYV